MYKKRNLIITFVILVLVLISLYLFKVSKLSNSDVGGKVSEILIHCSSKDTASYYSCFRNSVKPLVKSFGVNVVINSLNVSFEDQKFKENYKLSCHDLSHIVGEVTIESGGNLGETLVGCTKSCEYGCAHGALIGGLKQNPDLIQNISLICKPFYGPNYHPQDKDACEHGLGHAVTELTAMDLLKSLDLCSQIDTESAVNKCAEGVFMQITDYPEAPYFEIEGSIVSFCKSLPQKFNNVCLETASLHEYGRSKNVVRSILTCDSVPSKNYGKCVSNFTNLLYSNYNASSEKLLSFCKDYGSRDYMSCVKGVIEPDIISDPDAKVSIFLCDSLNPTNKVSCYRILGDRYQYVYGEESRVLFCSQMKNETKDLCLNSQN